MSTATETYREMTAEARAKAENDAVADRLRVALELVVKSGDRAESIAWQTSRLDRRFRLVAKAIKEARG